MMDSKTNRNKNQPVILSRRNLLPAAEMTDSCTNETKIQPVIFSRWNPLLPLPDAAVEISIRNDQNRKQDQILLRCNTFVPAVKIMEDALVIRESNKRKKKKHGEIMDDELQVMQDGTSNRRKKKKHGEVEDELKAVEIMEDGTSNKREEKHGGDVLAIRERKSNEE